MTVQNARHPDDELLAALAGTDRDTLADRALTDHVAGCDRCSSLVGELSFLRSALSELPDLAPSRPLRLLPPVPVPGQRGASAWLRRLVAPVVATGAGLLLVGAVGTAGLLGRVSLFSAAGASPGQDASAGENAFGPAANPEVTLRPQPSGPLAAASASGTPGQRSNDYLGSKETDNRPPATSNLMTWTVLLIAGAALMIGGLLLRYSLQPRAG